MSNETTITITGNLVAEPELRYTQNRAGRPQLPGRLHAPLPGPSRPVAGRRHLVPRRHRLAAAGRARRRVPDQGQPVIVTGRLRQRSYEAQDGSKRTVYEVQADDIAPSLRTAIAQITKTSRAGGAGQDAAAAAAGDPWSSGHGDEPPF